MKTTRPIIATRKSTKGNRQEITRINHNQGKNSATDTGVVLVRSSCSWYNCLYKQVGKNTM